MKNKFLILLLAVLASCGPKDKSEELQIRDLSKARNIIAEDNANTLQKVEKQYRKDTTEKVAKELCVKLKQIDLYKVMYLDSILKMQEMDFKSLNQKYTSACMALLTEDEKLKVIKELEGSILYHTALLEEVDYSAVIHHQLALEAEIFEEELYKVILEDFLKKKHKLDWNVIFDEHKH